MARYVFDIETDGLLDSLSKIHCIVMADIDTGEFFEYSPLTLQAGIAKLYDEATELVAHNGFWFDYIALQKITRRAFNPSIKLRDTLAEARLVYSNITDVDFARMRKGLGELPKNLIGSHSLKAWGYRLGILKGTFGETTDWKTYTPEMLVYCRQDVVVTLELVRKLESKKYAPQALWLENRISALMAQQEQNGFYFHEKNAVLLYAKLAHRRDKVKRELIEAFGWWNEPEPVKTPKRTVNYKDPSRASVVEGAPYTPFNQVEFNPSSRAHIVKRLKALYNWEPTSFTENGTPQVDETVMSRMDNPHAKLLMESFLLDKRIGQLAEGKNAWLKLVRNGFIHGRVNPNGAVTGRATHSNPNLAQVPSGRAEFGKDCRELYGVPLGWLLVGTDASGLELRCLGHFMARYDDGAYCRVILEGDIHWENVLALGLVPAGTVRDKHNEQHEWARGVAKTFIYAFLYGAGSEKIGSIVLPNASPEEQTKEGNKLKKRFLKSLPALKMLIDAVKASAKRGWLKGLDGRQVFVRSEHAALNTLLQSAGALICKRWLIAMEDIMAARGYSHGWSGDYAFCAWVHDEAQIAVTTREIAEEVGQISKQAMKVAEMDFDFRCPLDADFAIGSTWAETH